MKRIISSLDEYNRLAQLDKDQRDKRDNQKVTRKNQEREFWNTIYKIQDNVSTEVRDIISKYCDNACLDNLEVKCDYYDTVYNITIQYGEHSRDVALRWHVDIQINTRSNIIKKETGSWSGLDAIGKHKIEDLEQTVEMLRAINNISDNEWIFMISRFGDIQYTDYVTQKVDKIEDYTLQQLDALADTDKCIMCKDRTYTDGKCIILDKATSKMYVYEVYARHAEGDWHYEYTHTCRKEDIVRKEGIIVPLDVFDM